MAWSPASGRSEIEGELRQIAALADGEVDLARTALLLAALDRPKVSLTRYEEHLGELASEVKKRGSAADTLDQKVTHLNEVLLELYRYEGDRRSYDDLQNANLMRVIDRRRGLPVALAILYIHAARAQPLTVNGLNFPAHFLIRLESDGERVILDPFHQGRRLETHDLRTLLKSMQGPGAELLPQHTAAIGNRDILLRLQNNIKVRLLQRQQSEEALTIIESMLMIAPDRAELWREAGILHGHLENFRAALMSFENTLELAEDETLRHEAASLIQKIQGHLN